MRDEMREQLNTEITRKQFLQYIAGAALMVLGLHNLLAFLSGHKTEHHMALVPSNHDGFGGRKFGV